jgi:glucose-1-phosphate adenylyltransferase
VGTVDAYVETQLDLLGPRPRFCLANPAWPIRGANPRGRRDGSAAPTDSIVAPDASCRGARLQRCVLQRGARVGRAADLERCIVMGGARIGSGVRLAGAIVGGGSTLTRDMRLDLAERARARGLRRTPGGVLVVPPRACVPAQGASAAPRERAIRTGKSGAEPALSTPA